MDVITTVDADRPASSSSKQDSRPVNRARSAGNCAGAFGQTCVDSLSWFRIAWCAARRLRPGIDPQLVGQQPAGAVVQLQRVRLPVRPVQREHQLLDQLLAERVRGHQRGQLGDHLLVLAQFQLQREALLRDGDPPFVESLGLHPQHLAVQARQRRAPPQRESGAQQPDRLGGFHGLRGRHVPFEGEDVERRGTQRDPVAGTVRDDQARHAECGPQVADRLLDLVLAGRGRLTVPHHVDQLRQRHHPVRREQQRGEHLLTAHTAELEPHTGVACLDRPQNPEVHGRHRRAKFAFRRNGNETVVRRDPELSGGTDVRTTAVRSSPAATHRNFAGVIAVGTRWGRAPPRSVASPPRGARGMRRTTDRVAQYTAFALVAGVATTLVLLALWL
ncbi:hypothetical protein GCM10022267_63110 [Lentzea roselyniae]